MKQGQNLAQKQQNKQGYYLSQQHLKQMHLLHLTGFALREYLANELELNPALEIDHDDDDELSEVTVDSIEAATEWTTKDEDELFRNNYQQASTDQFYRAPVIQFNSLADSLKEQIHQMQLSTTLTQLSCYLIDELNDDGYLRRSLAEVCDDYCFNRGKLTDEKEFETALHAVQHCEPAGVGARDLRECLLLQLNYKIVNFGVNYEMHKAQIILENHYDLFVQRAFSKIKSLLELTDESFKKVTEVITHLQPKPVTEVNRYELMNYQIIPDFEITIEDDELYVGLTQPDSAKLRVISDFKKSPMRTENNEEKNQAASYYSNLVDDANALVNALREREVTMLKVMSAIAFTQPGFFISGDRNDLKPMVLQDIAGITGFDLSTVSRITSNKYVQTPHGIFPLKNLFMRNINPGIAYNSQHTAVGIQQTIKQLIEEEDKNNPMSDSEVVEALQQKGITLARRTVVKYREVLSIKNSNLRKSSN
ncbi:MAG: RNA polymerase factor sigma-54 [Bacteroidia bacterium]